MRGGCQRSERGEKRARRTSDGEKGCEGEVRCMLGKGAARVSESREQDAAKGPRGARVGEGQGSERGKGRRGPEVGEGEGSEKGKGRREVPWERRG